MKARNHVFVLYDDEGAFLAIAARRDGRCVSGWKPFASRTIRKPGPPFEFLKSFECECGCGKLDFSEEAEEEIELWLESEFQRCQGQKS